MSNRSHIAEYRQNRVAGMEGSDDPHRTITLLLQGVIERVRSADSAIVLGDVPGKIRSINSALDIIEVLRASLDHEAGGQIAAGLEALYVYVSECLVQANASNQREPLAEAVKLLSEITSAWAAIPKPSPSAAL